MGGVKRHPVLRSWPWTIALAAAITLIVLLGVVGAQLATSIVESVFALVVVAAGLLALYRVLTSGVHVLPSGLIVRELTRSTPVPWVRIRKITVGPTGRKGVYAPVLVVGGDKLELTVLASYREDVAKRRADELSRARARLGG